MPIGRIQPKQNFHVIEEVEIIHQTITTTKPGGEPHVQHEKFIKLLTTPNNAQRQQLIQQYRTKYGGCLVDELKKKLPPSELATNQLFFALLEAPAVHDAKFLQKAMKGLGTDEDALIEVLVTRSNAQVRAIKQAYKELYGNELANDVASETSGAFQALLLDLLENNRDETLRTDVEKAKKDAEALYKAGEKKWGTDEEVFVKILANQNLSQLLLMFNEYEKLTGHSMEKAIKSEFSGDELKALLAICAHVRNGPAGEVAELLHKCIQSGAKDDMLVHLIVSHSEVDLHDIANEYQKRFNVPLEQAIQNSAGKSAVLKNALISLVKGNK